MCPVVLLLLASTPFAQEPIAPPPKALRAAVAGIMQKAGAPDGCKNSGSMANKWAKIERKREEFRQKDVAVVWPSVADDSDRRGRSLE